MCNNITLALIFHQSRFESVSQALRRFHLSCEEAFAAVLSPTRNGVSDTRSNSHMQTSRSACRWGWQQWSGLYKSICEKVKLCANHQYCLIMNATADVNRIASVTACRTF